MKKIIFFPIALMFMITISKAQTTAMQFSGLDCNNNYVDLFADLNAGKAVVLHFYMPNCASCPPPAQKIKAMATKIMNTYPGMIKGYAFPFQNSTTCAYSASWVSLAGLTGFYAPMDSGATQVAYYGGFGMPTVVLLGGTDHRVMFSTLSFANSDTTIMRDSILNLFNGATGINDIQNTISNVAVYPNPATTTLKVELNILKTTNVKIDVVNLMGEVVMNVYESETAAGTLKKEISITDLKNGIYTVRVNADGKLQNYNFTVAH